MRSWTKMGADLVCFGAKYFGAPHSTGLLCGRRDLVDSAVQQGFIGFERGKYRTFGRPLKLDRGEIVAVALALEEWVTMDHEARIARVRERAEAAIGKLAGLPRVTATAEGSYFGAPGLRVRIDPAGGKTAEEVARALEKGSPSIVASQSGDAISFNLTTVYEGDELVIAERLREALAA